MKITISIIIVALLVAAGGAYYYFFAFDKEAVTKKALEGNGSITCSDDEMEDASFSVHNGNIRMKVTDSAPISITNTKSDEKVATHILRKNDIVYVWSNEEDYGWKLSREESDQMMGMEEITDDLGESGSLTCSRIVDAENFEPKEDIEFLTSEEVYEKAKEEREAEESSKR